MNRLFCGGQCQLRPRVTQSPFGEGWPNDADGASPESPGTSGLVSASGRQILPRIAGYLASDSSQAASAKAPPARPAATRDRTLRVSSFFGHPRKTAVPALQADAGLRFGREQSLCILTSHRTEIVNVFLAVGAEALLLCPLHCIPVGGTLKRESQPVDQAHGID